MGTRTAFTALVLLISTSPTFSQPAADPAAIGATVALAHQRRIAPGVQALPRLTPQPGIAYEAINRAMARLDAEARTSIKDCDAMAKGMDAPAGGSFTRDVSIPMAGPGYLTVRMDDYTSCGSAYPTTDAIGITYDLATGKPVDWVALLGADLGGKADVSEQSGKPTGYLISPALFRLWIKARGSSTDEPGNDDCQGIPREATGPLEVWADARGGGIAVSSTDVVHATAVCGRPAVILVNILRGKGVSAPLLDSITAGKRATAASR